MILAKLVGATVAVYQFILLGDDSQVLATFQIPVARLLKLSFEADANAMV